MTNLTRKAFAGVGWNYAGAAVLVVTQVASTAATARLVSPREFGAYATAQAAAGLLGYFALRAVGQGVLRRPELGPMTVGTATTLSLLGGVAASLALWLLADPWARAWHVPAAAQVIHALSFTLLFGSAAIVPLTLLLRNLRFRSAAVTETTTAVLGTATGVGLAVHLHSAFALAAGQSVGAAALLVVASFLSFRDLRLGFDRAEARELFSFAGQVTILNFGMYLLNTAPNWFSARNYGAQTLGVLSRANLIVDLPTTYLSSGLTKVLYPLYGRVRNDEARAKLLLDETISMATGFAWPLFGLLAGAAPVVVAVLLGPGWDGTAPLIALFAALACGNFPCGLLTNAAEAFGWMRTIWGRQLAFLALLAGDLALVHLADLGVEALVAGMVIAQWAAYAFTLSAFLGRGFFDRRTVARTHAVHGLLALVAFGCAALAAHLSRDAAVAVQLAAQIAVALGVGGTILAARRHFPAGRILTRRLARAGELGLGSPLPAGSATPR